MRQALLGDSAMTEQERAHGRLVLGILAFGQGDYESAAPALGSAKDAYDKLGDTHGAAMAAIPLGVIEAVRSAEDGEDLLHASVRAFRALDDRWGLAFALFSLGGALLLHQRLADAVAPLEEAVHLARDIDNDVFLSNALVNLGWVRFHLGDPRAAADRLIEVLEHLTARDDPQSRARALEALAAVAAEVGDAQRGATLFAAAKRARRSVGAAVWATDRVSHERTAERLCDSLDEIAYHAATERGAALTGADLLTEASALHVR